MVRRIQASLGIRRFARGQRVVDKLQYKVWLKLRYIPSREFINFRDASLG
jgi:hypothetical protein